MSSYEGSSLTEIEAVLDGLTNATSEQVYDATRGYSPKALASVAASRADAAGGGGAEFPDEWTVRDDGSFVISNTDTDFGTLAIQGPIGATRALLAVDVDDGLGGFTRLFEIGPPGGSLQYSPDPDNSGALFRFLSTGQLEFSNADGDDFLAYNPGSGTLDLDPQNGQVYVRAGSLVLAGSEPVDATLAFNGCFAVYVDGSDLKAKAKIDGSFVHATLGTFA